MTHMDITTTVTKECHSPQDLCELSTKRRWLAIVYLILAIHLFCFLIWFPKAITITDEQHYLSQAVALAHGSNRYFVDDPTSGTRTLQVYDVYSPGTAILMVPFILVLGWRGAFVVTLLSSLLAVTVTAHWLVRMKHSPLWSLLLLFYLPFLVLSRTGMSEIPSAALAAIVFSLLWQATEVSWPRWLVAGLLAGSSVLLRETNAILFAPIIVLSLIRFRSRAFPLVIGVLFGGCVAIAIRLLLCGSLLRRGGSDLSHFSYTYIPANLLPHLGALLLFIPGGLIAVLLYRGYRRLELSLTVALFAAIHLMWWFNASGSGLTKQAILGPGRFYVPLIPLLIMAIASVVEDRAGSFTAWLKCATSGFRGSVVICIGILACTGALICMHRSMDRWANGYVEMRRIVYGTIPRDAIVLTNLLATNKVFNPVYASEYGPRTALELTETSTESIQRMFARRLDLWVAILYRTDSTFWIAQNSEKDDALAAVRKICNITKPIEEKISATEVICIYHLIPAAW